MSGGYNPLKDLYKMRVFETCRWRNANHRDWMKGPEGQVIPPQVIDKPPTAELREDQKDSDSLPPYPVLDDILERLVDKEQSVAEVVASGHDREVVKRVEHLIYISEYKRFQSAPGPASNVPQLLAGPPLPDREPLAGRQLSHVAVRCCPGRIRACRARRIR